MRLSEAIRLGAMLHPQCFQTLYLRGEDQVTIVASCALGAAEAAGYSLFALLARDKAIDRKIYQCPRCHRRSETTLLISHLNDVHGWTRERIADFVATIELADGGPAPTVDAVDPHAYSTGPMTPRAEAPSSSSSLSLVTV